MNAMEITIVLVICLLIFGFSNTKFVSRLLGGVIARLFRIPDDSPSSEETKSS